MRCLCLRREDVLSREKREEGACRCVHLKERKRRRRERGALHNKSEKKRSESGVTAAAVGEITLGGQAKCISGLKALCTAILA